VRLTRRRFAARLVASLAGGLAALAAAPLAAPSLTGAVARGARREAGPSPITVTSRTLTAFWPRDPERQRFGALAFRGGLQLSSPDEDFGGFSGLWCASDGADLVAVSDRGLWLTGRVARDARGRPAALTDAALAPILNASGRAVADTRGFDTEGLSIVDGIAHVSVERTHEVLRFDWARRGVLARGVSLSLGRQVRDLPRNRSLEAIAVAPAASPVAGQILAIAERSGDEDGPTMGLLVSEGRRQRLEVARQDGYDISDCAFLPSGDLLLLERWYSPWSGVAIRIRRVPAAEVGAGRRLEGTRILDVDMGHEIDNFEGLAVHRQAGETRLTLISDDNFSALQRTLLMEFALVD
jgi:hypothetical protein